MRAFIVLCLVATAYADKLGYNYQPVGHSDSGLSFAPGSGSGNLGGLLGNSLGGGSIGGGSLGGGSLGGGSLGGNSLGGGSLGGGSLGGGSLGGGSLGDGSLGGSSLGSAPSGLSAPVSYNAAPQAELQKEFFTFQANDAEFDEPQALDRVSGSLNKGLRVIFIKGPENRGLENAALALAKQAAQQETAIYVLNKQADIGDLAQKLNAIRSNSNNKPEVHFVKYRTPEDAANAQRAIQGQYDSLGGSTQSRDGGVAPVLNFASQAPIRQAQAKAPENAYLPTSIFRRV